MYCPDCGRETTADARFCPGCGKPLKAARFEGSLPEGIVLDEFGDLTWTYGQKVLRDPRPFRIAWLILTVPFMLFTGIPVLLNRAWGELWIMFWVLMGITAIVLLSWGIMAVVYRGTMLYEIRMNSEKIEFSIVGEGAARMNRLMGAASVMGRLSGKGQAARAAGTASVSMSGYCRFQDVKSLTAKRRYDCINIRVGITLQSYYASPGQFEFVWNYLKEHCPQAKIKGK